MRKAAIILGVIAALLIAALLVIPKFININTYHAQIQKQLQQALSRPVTFGEMHLSLLPLRVSVDNLVIGEDPAFGTGSFASAGRLDASVAFWPLLHKEVQIQSLTLRQPKVQLIKSAQGVWNFASLGKGAPPATPQAGTKPSPAPAAKAPTSKTAAPAQEQAAGGPSLPQQINISNGELLYIDRQNKFQGTYTGLDLAVDGFKPGHAFDLNLSAHLPGKGAETLSLDGRAGPIDQATPANTPFDGNLKFDEVSLAGLQKVMQQKNAMVDGVATGTVKLKNQGGALRSDGSVKLEQAVVKGVNIGYPITLDYDVNGDLNKGQWQISKGTLHLGPTPISISGSINTAPTPMQVNVQFSTKDASLEEAARLASAFGVAFSPGMKVAGKVNADVHAQGPVTAPAMNGTLSADSVNVSGEQLKQPVQVSNVALNMTPAEIRSNTFTAATGGTRLAAQFAMQNYTSPQPVVQAHLSTANAQVGELLSIAQAYGVSAAEGMSGSGVISLDVQAQGPMKNSSAMTFTGSGSLRNASLTMPSLHAPLNVRTADLRFASNSMALQNLNASLGSTNASGTMTVSNFNAPHLQFTLNADKVNVVELQQITGTATPAKTAEIHGGLIPAAWAAPAPAAAQPSLLEKATGGGHVSIGTLLYDQLQMQNVNSNLTLDHGVIRMDPVTAQIYGGQQTGAIMVDMRKTPMDVQVSSKMQQVDANKLLSSVSSLKQTLYGLLAANGNTTFRVSPNQDIARTLNGKLSLDLTKGKLAGIDMLNSLAQVAKFNSGGGNQAFTELIKLAGNFNIVNGIAQTNDLTAEIPGGSLAGVGSIGLPDNSLNMHVTAVLSNALSQKVGGTGIGGFMQTALANKKGELVIPVIITGTFSSPRIAPDVQKIAQMRLQNLLPTTGSPGSLTSGILGALGKQGGQQGQQGGLSGVLGAIAGQQAGQAQQQPRQPAAASGQQQPAQAQPQQEQNPLGNLIQQIQKARDAKKKKQQEQPQGPPH